MIGYGKNVDTGKFHKIELISWTDAELDPEPLDNMPVGAIYGGLFKIEDGVCHFLPPQKILELKKRTKRQD